MSFPALLRLIDPELRKELLRRVESPASFPDTDRFAVTKADIQGWLQGHESSEVLAAWAAVKFARPTLPISDGRPALPHAPTWYRLLTLASRDIERASQAVGRIELEGHPGLRWAGNCWLAAQGVAVTTGAIGRELTRFRDGIRWGSNASVVRVRFEASSHAVKDVLATDATALGPELAFLILEAADGAPNPVPLTDAAPRESALVAAIGHVASDSRAGNPLAGFVYSESVERKCLAPGRLIACEPGKGLRHDCATIGNSAGALILDLNTGAALGVHVTGALDGPGCGVTSTDIREALEKLGIPTHRAEVGIAAEGDEFFEARRRTAEDYAGRVGYEPGFVGVDVPPPEPTDAIKNEVVTFSDAEGKEATLLPYEHFSLCMSKSRRMCLFTACNVEGGQLTELTRTGTRWLFDPRIGLEFQAGDELYKSNDLDRGHMVRRLDPVWGDGAVLANEDTFHFTNSCPQHKDLNQKIWNDLEEYVLQNAGRHQLRLNVFTGPIFRDGDPVYRDFRLPLEYWKVVVMLKEDGKLSATAYVLSQADMVTGLEFVFGEFRTYQVPLADVEEWTHLDFGRLREFDPKNGEESLESTARFQPIESADNLRL